MRRLLLLPGLCAFLALAGGPKLGPKVKLFNGKNLEGFYTYIEKHGKNNDPDRVFRIENGAVHVSGSEFGYFITKRNTKIIICTRCSNGASIPTNRARTRHAIVACCFT